MSDNVHLKVNAANARELMSATPSSIDANARLQDAVELFAKGYNALPVVNADGHPVGVISRGDLLLRVLEHLGVSATNVDDWNRMLLQDPVMGMGSAQLAKVRIKDLMTPTVETVSPATPAITVVTKMLLKRVHQLFVVDENGALLGIITPVDVLFALKP